MYKITGNVSFIKDGHLCILQGLSALLESQCVLCRFHISLKFWKVLVRTFFLKTFSRHIKLLGMTHQKHFAVFNTMFYFVLKGLNLVLHWRQKLIPHIEDKYFETYWSRSGSSLFGTNLVSLFRSYGFHKIHDAYNTHFELRTQFWYVYFILFSKQ